MRQLDNKDNNRDTSAVTVKDVLLELRRSRLGLIQTAQQLYFSYKAIIEGIKHFNDPVSRNDEAIWSNYFRLFIRGIGEL